MADLEWRRTADGFAADRYRVGRVLPPSVSSPRWRLTVMDVASMSASRRTPVTSLYGSLASAKCAAGRAHLEHLRWARVQGHVVIAVLAWLLAFSVSLDSVLAYFVFLLCFSLGASSLADAGCALVQRADDPSRPGEPRYLSWMDRRVVALIATLDIRRMAAIETDAAPAISYIDPL